MKKLALCVAMFMAATATFSQMEKVKLAKKAASGETPDFATAEKLINEALEDPATKNLPDAWYNKGLIYAKQFDFEDDKRFLVPPQKPDVDVQSKASYNAYKAWIVADSLDVVESINNPKRKGKLKFRNDIVKKLAAMKNYISNYGIIMFNNTNYVEAKNVVEDFMAMPTLAMFKESDKINASDSLFYYAKENDQLILKQLYQQQFANKDTLGAEKTLKIGSEKYPTNSFFLTYMIQHDIWANREKEAMDNLNKAILLNDKEPVYYLVRGNVYSLKADKRSEARADYKKALELKPDFFEVVYALADLSKTEGDSHYNTYIDLEMKRPKDAASEKEMAVSAYKEAISYFEKARTMKTPVDDALLQSLQGLYRKLKMYDKEKEIRSARGL